MVMLKPNWLLERGLPSQLLKVGNQLLTLPSSSKDLIGLLDKVESIVSQEYQNPLASIQNALVPLKGVLLSEEFGNHVSFDVHISIAYTSLSSFRLPHQIPLLKMS